MEIEAEKIDNGITKISLNGRMDIEGTSAIDVKFAVLTNIKNAAVLVDMSEVNFIASIGMRTLLSSAKLLARSGGKMVLAQCQPLVKEALNTAGMDTLIPTFDEMDDAISELQP